jgi:DnaJ-class molecular chaperone
MATDPDKLYEECESCQGIGSVIFNLKIPGDPDRPVRIGECPDCDGDGVVEHDCSD